MANQSDELLLTPNESDMFDLTQSGVEEVTDTVATTVANSAILPAHPAAQSLVKTSRKCKLSKDSTVRLFQAKMFMASTHSY